MKKKIYGTDTRRYSFVPLGSTLIIDVEKTGNTVVIRNKKRHPEVVIKSALGDQVIELEGIIEWT